jgi:hypothetical protein
MKNMTSQEIHDAIRRGLDEVDRRLASGELDGSGRFYADEELAAGAATGRLRKPETKAETPAALAWCLVRGSCLTLSTHPYPAGILYHGQRRPAHGKNARDPGRCRNYS